MPEQPSVISYETPAPPQRAVKPIVWWFVADGLLFFVGFMIAAAYYHDSYNPSDPGPPPAVELTINVLLLSSAALFVSLVTWVAVSKLRRRGRVG